MVKNLGRHYTYKVTFPGMPWFYFGVHTENGKPYYGSPKTHRWIWRVYEFEIQILEWFNDRKEAERVEDRLIKHFLNDPNCLNEHYGSVFSRESALRGVTTQVESGRVAEMGREQGRKNVESGHLARVAASVDRTKAGKAGAETNRKNKTGWFHPDFQREMSRRARGLGLAKAIENDPHHQSKAGKAGGIKVRDCKLGMFGMDPGHRSEVSRQVGKRVAKKLNGDKYYDPDHPELGQHSAGTLTMMQKRRGFPSGPDNRVKVVNECP
jgi:hypothetical protein